MKTAFVDFVIGAFESMKKLYLKICLMVFPLLFLFQCLASAIGNAIARLFDYRVIDNDNLFMHITIHHIVQMLIAIIAIWMLHKRYQWSFNLKITFSKAGIKYTIIFFVVMLGYVFLSYFIGYGVGMIEPYNYELNTRNILGILGFQLLSGPSEEMLFRALPITVLLSMLKTDNHHKGSI